MIDAVQVATQNVSPNLSIIFGNTRIETSRNRCCRTIRHEEGSGRFVITKPGIYQVLFSGSVSTVEAGEAILNIMQDSEPIAGGKMGTTTTAAANYNVCAAVLVKVDEGCCSTVTVNNIGTGAVNVSDANIVITRKC